MNLMSVIDRICARSTRSLARHTGRRHALSRIAAGVLGTAALPLLPVARAGAEEQPDIHDCAHWRYCAMDGYNCGCCGGTYKSCPPGTEMSPITWVGLCHNPNDGLDYIVSYNDCCGKTTCNRCFCSRADGEKPIYFPAKSAHLNWCVGATTNTYHCSTAILVGIADQK